MGLGFFLRVFVADTIGYIVDETYNNLNMVPGLSILVSTFFFGIQIYCDFNGYSLIARGCAKILGIDLVKNFNRPYFSKSISEFWRRWHVSLSFWFRDYVYIPLGGSRCSKKRHYLNLFITFLLSGIWHGANWTFAIWGCPAHAELAEFVVIL
jgi:D-alanyl-lipoteichoic acid acyltransferase DltB (MBOAT superfamily)